MHLNPLLTPFVSIAKTAPAEAGSGRTACLRCSCQLVTALHKLLLPSCKACKSHEMADACQPRQDLQKCLRRLDFKPSSLLGSACLQHCRAASAIVQA